MKLSKKQQDILRQLKKLNEFIEKLIQPTLEQVEIVEELQSLAFLDETTVRKRKCWEIKKCKEFDCPCRIGEDYRCWLIMGSFNNGCCQGFYAKKYTTCRDCDVFKQYQDTPVTTLYENINILVTHFVEKIKKERDLAIRDGLTGFYNRNFLKMIVKGDILDLNNKSFPLSVIIFDLDRLKAINDTYGHITGDKMIKELGEFLRKHKREPDLLFRMGGDEFMLMMSGVDEKRRILAENRLVGLISNWNRRRKKIMPVSLSFSLGGATGFWGKDLDQIILEADKKMYFHKQSKRDEVSQEYRIKKG